MLQVTDTTFKILIALLVIVLAANFIALVIGSTSTIPQLTKFNGLTGSLNGDVNSLSLSFNGLSTGQPVAYLNNSATTSCSIFCFASNPIATISNGIAYLTNGAYGVFLLIINLLLIIITMLGVFFFIFIFLIPALLGSVGGTVGYVIGYGNLIIVLGLALYFADIVIDLARALFVWLI